MSNATGIESTIKTLTIIIFVISICNFGYYMYNSIGAEMINPYCCEMADDTPEEKMQKSERAKNFANEQVLAKEKVKQIAPISLQVGILCLIGFVVLFILSFTKKELRNTKILTGSLMILNILFVLMEL